MRAYIRVLPDLYQRKALGVCDTADCQREHAPYPANALGAFLGVLCLGETQTPSGRFASAAVLAALLDGPQGVGVPYSVCVPFLVEQGDLVEQSDGSLYIDGWDELQTGDWTVQDRMRRYRQRKSGKPVEPVLSDEEDPAVAYMQIIGRFPRGKAIEWIDDLIRQFGAEATRRAIAHAAERGTDNLLGRASDALRVDARKAELRERAAEQRKVAEGHRARNNVTLLVAYHNNGAHADAPNPECPECGRNAA